MQLIAKNVPNQRFLFFSGSLIYQLFTSFLASDLIEIIIIE